AEDGIRDRNVTGVQTCALPILPVRDAEGELLPGVSSEDDGPKGGLNGIDNGRLAFDQVRIPRTNLLNRYGDVSPDGTYTSPIESPGRRIFSLLGTLLKCC